MYSVIMSQAYSMSRGIYTVVSAFPFIRLFVRL